MSPALPPTSCGWHKANVTRLEDESRVLGVRFGANPNSSSLGVDVTFLLFGATFAGVVALVLGAFLRAGGSRATQVGDSATQGGSDSPPTRVRDDAAPPAGDTSP